MMKKPRKTLAELQAEVDEHVRAELTKRLPALLSADRWGPAPDEWTPLEQLAIGIIDRMQLVMLEASHFARLVSSSSVPLGSFARDLQAWATEFAGLGGRKEGIGKGAFRETGPPAPSGFHERLMNIRTPKVSKRNQDLRIIVQREDRLRPRQAGIKPHDDRTVAMVALLVGYWPKLGLPVDEATPAHVVTVVTKGVHKARIELARERSRRETDE